MSAMILAISASMLWSSANLDMLIAGNIRRVTQAKIAANSGINHFIALNLDYSSLRRQATLHDGVIIPMTRLSSKTSYLVKVDMTCCAPERYIVKSVGYYRKGEEIIASHPVRATFLLK